MRFARGRSITRREHDESATPPATSQARRARGAKRERVIALTAAVCALDGSAAAPTPHSDPRCASVGPAARLQRRHSTTHSGTSVSATIMNCWNQMPGRVGDEDRQREPDDVEREVQDDAGEQAEVEVEQAEADRREDQLDRPRERRLVRIRRVARAEDDRLHDEGDHEEQPPLAEAIADERGARRAAPRGTGTPPRSPPGTSWRSPTATARRSPARRGGAAPPPATTSRTTRVVIR